MLDMLQEKRMTVNKALLIDMPKKARHATMDNTAAKIEANYGGLFHELVLVSRIGGELLKEFSVDKLKEMLTRLELLNAMDYPSDEVNSYIDLMPFTNDGIARFTTNLLDVSKYVTPVTVVATLMALPSLRALDNEFSNSQGSNSLEVNALIVLNEAWHTLNVLAAGAIVVIRRHIKDNNF